MKKVCFMTLIVFSCFVIELVFFNLFGNAFKPNLLVLLVIFYNVRLGTSSSLYVAFLSGLLKDSFSAGVFGTYLSAFIISAFATTLLKVYFYQKEFRLSRISLVFIVSSVHVLSAYFISSMLGVIEFPLALKEIYFPEVLSTTVVSFFAFKGLKQCVLKFSA